MQGAWLRELKDHGRGIAGALIFGTPFVLTMETWHIAWTHPVWVVLPTAFAAALLIIGLSQAAGFRKNEAPDGPRTFYAWATEAAEIMVQSLAAAYFVLSLYGIADWRAPATVLARLGILQIAALGLGAALANRILRGEEESAERQPLFVKSALFALGSLFFILHIAPTDETWYLAAHAGWVRIGLLAAASILVAELVLFELELRGQSGRTGRRAPWLHWGESFYIFFLAIVVAGATLAAFGQWAGQSPTVWLQTAVVLAFPAAIGGSAARVVVR